jgi:glutaredoxin
LIPLREQEFLREKFSRELINRVRIDFFTQKKSSLFVRHRQPCQYCKPVRQMLEELAALTDGISLRQHVFEEDKEVVAQYQVERIPAISRGTNYLSAKIRKRLRKLKDDVRIQVFVTPACPHCSQMARLAYQVALESPRISTEVIEASEFPELSQRYQVRAVPTTVIDDKMSFAGSVPEDLLVDTIERVIQSSPLTAMEAPETGPVTPTSEPSDTAAGGKIILP